MYARRARVKPVVSSLFLRLPKQLAARTLTHGIVSGYRASSHDKIVELCCICSLWIRVRKRWHQGSCHRPHMAAIIPAARSTIAHSTSTISTVANARSVTDTCYHFTLSTAATAASISAISSSTSPAKSIAATISSISSTSARWGGYLGGLEVADIEHVLHTETFVDVLRGCRHRHGEPSSAADKQPTCI